MASIRDAATPAGRPAPTVSRVNGGSDGVKYVGRLAPAPTGALHLGNARTFLIAWLRARRAGGTLILRLEDLDHPKVKAHAAAEAYRDLAWLGLDWDTGPAASYPPYGQDNPAPDEYIQSHRLERYSEALRRLQRAGLTYPCVCTRKELLALHSAPNAGEDLVENRYPGTCRGVYADAREAIAASGREPGWRFRLSAPGPSRFRDGFHGDQESDLAAWSGDFLVARGDRAGYQLAVVVDDYAMGVTEVVRGDDLLPSTHRQLVLYHALGYRPPAFFHVPLVVGRDGRRLAKRHGDTRLTPLRQSGKGPERILGWLAHSCGWAPAGREMSLAEIWEKCDFSLIPPGRVVLEDTERRWMGFT